MGTYLGSSIAGFDDHGFVSCSLFYVKCQEDSLLPSVGNSLLGLLVSLHLGDHIQFWGFL